VDNIFVERLWRSLKYEEVYLNACTTAAEAKAALAPGSSFTTRSASVALVISHE
jgi:putative transposase